MTPISTPASGNPATADVAASQLHPEATQRALQGVVCFFEGLSPASLASLGHIYAGDAQFKDPFNEVQGLPAIRAIFEHMYVKLDEPRFVVTQAMAQGDQAFIVWLFHFRFRGEAQTQTIRGASHVRFNAEGLVEMHRDYWDAAEELYEKLPVLGGFMRWLKRKAGQ
jgi:hypothetical protein